MHTTEQKRLADVINACVAQGVMSSEQARVLAHKELRDKSHSAARHANPRPLWEWDRVCVDGDDGCHWREYGWMPLSVVTDEDAEEWVDKQQMWVTSPYDCSGQTFTRWIDWHRNPCGRYSFVHYMAIDV